MDKAEGVAGQRVARSQNKTAAKALTEWPAERQEETKAHRQRKKRDRERERDKGGEYRKLLGQGSAHWSSGKPRALLPTKWSKVASGCKLQSQTDESAAAPATAAVPAAAPVAKVLARTSKVRAADWVAQWLSTGSGHATLHKWRLGKRK